MTPDCRRLDDLADEVAGGAVLPPGLAAHAEACAGCRARLDLAGRIERALATWPVASPPPHFAAAVAAAAHREEWRRELVVDWGFNVAIAASLLVILAGVGGLVWTLGAAADVSTAADATAAVVGGLLERVRSQAAVVGTATVLLTGTVGAWWWVEERTDW
ncbi:MAG: hypothetical protein AB7O28_20795 [Vicinamibacterales bacterium]